jgi:hypothetical protein
MTNDLKFRAAVIGHFMHFDTNIKNPASKDNVS